MAVGALVRCAG